MGKTVRELRTGRPGPLTYAEYVAWRAYAKYRVAEQTRLNAKKPPQRLWDW